MGSYFLSELYIMEGFQRGDPERLPGDQNPANVCSKGRKLCMKPWEGLLHLAALNGRHRSLVFLF